MQSKRGASLLAVILLVVAGTAPIGYVVQQYAQKVKSAQRVAARSEAISILRYFSKASKHHSSWQNTLNAGADGSSAANAPVKTYFTDHSGATPRTCPRQETCETPAAPTRCPAGAPVPACDPPPPEAPIDLYDMGGARIIDAGGTFLDAGWQSTTVNAAKWRIQATWSRQPGYQVHLNFTVTAYSNANAVYPTVKMLQPVKHCVVIQGEKYRYSEFMPWNYSNCTPLFMAWDSGWARCPTGYKVAEAHSLRHPANANSSEGVLTPLNATQVQVSNLSNIAGWAMLQRTGTLCSGHHCLCGLDGNETYPNGCYNGGHAIHPTCQGAYFVGTGANSVLDSGSSLPPVNPARDLNTTQATCCWAEEVIL